MSLVNAFHVYSSGDLSRKRKKDSLLSEDPNLTRIVSIRTNTPEEDTRLYYQPFVFLIVPNVISNILPPPPKITRESFLHVFFHTRSNTFSYVERKWISRCDYTWIRSRRAITGLFARPLSTFFFFFLFTHVSYMYEMDNQLEKDSNTIGITREKDQRFIFQRSFIIFLCREFDKKKKKNNGS